MAKRDTIASHFREPKENGTRGTLEGLIEDRAPTAPVPAKPIPVESETDFESFEIPIREGNSSDVETDPQRQ